MGVVVGILIVAGIAGGVWWNRQNANRAMEGVSFVLPYPPTAVAAAIEQAHNRGTRAALRGAFGGMSVRSMGGTRFEAISKIGDSGEIMITRDVSGSLVSARALVLHVGLPPKQLNHRGGIWGLSVNLSNGLYTMLGITPGSAKIKRWQRGLEGRIAKVLAKATA